MSSAEERLALINGEQVIKEDNLKECSYCRNKDITVDRGMFDGMCANCTTKALYDANISEIARENNRHIGEQFG